MEDGKNEAANNAAQNNNQAPAAHSVFDLPASQPAAAAPAAGKSAEELAAETANKNQSLFSETLFPGDTTNTQQPGATTEVNDDLIAKLQASGYKIEKQEVVDESAQFKQKLDFHEKNIQEASAFIAKDDAFIVKEKLKNEKADLYNGTGRSALINSEEFNIEVEAQFEAEFDNPAVLKTYADNMRNAIKTNVIDKNTAEKGVLVSQAEAKQKTEIAERTKKLDASFDSLYKDGYLGMKFEDKEVIEARNKVISGDFSNEIKKNPEILAKLALVFYQEQKLKDKVGQPNYGEGVRDAVHALNGDQKHNNTSAMNAASNVQAGSQAGTFDINKWLNPAEEEEDKNKRVI